MDEDRDEYVDDDIANLDYAEDPVPEEADEGIAAPSWPDEAVEQAPTAIYRLRFGYSRETVLGSWAGEPLALGDIVVTPTRYGLDLATIIGIVRSGIAAHDPTKIARIATEADRSRSAANEDREREAFSVARQKIEAHHLDMKLVSVHFLLEESKILFFFTAENRVDFRDLVKDLVGIFKTRIELRQIGVRDESRVVGGLGVCGRGYCCHTVSDKLKPVSIKMAKDQNLSLNSMKISGPCGRLLCCLSYEHGYYQEERRAMPPEGCRLQYEGTQFKIVEVNPVTGRVRMSGEDGRVLECEKTRFERVDGRWRCRPGDISD